MKIVIVGDAARTEADAVCALPCARARIDIGRVRAGTLINGAPAAAPIGAWPQRRGARASEAGFDIPRFLRERERRQYAGRATAEC